MMVRYLIVGQGIAGTLIALECLKRNLDFKVIGSPVLSRASRVAAGIINPITGRKFVKTWMYEALEPAFLSTYAYAEQLLGVSYLADRKIIRAVRSVKDENNWESRLLQDDASTYMSKLTKDVCDFKSIVNAQEAYGIVKGYQLNIKALVDDFRFYLERQGKLITDVFDHSQLKVGEKEVVYGGIRSKHIVFCEGHLVSKNPYFKHLPFTPAKGELLLLKIPSLKTEQILKDNLFITPFEDDLFWAGATYGWDNFNDLPSEEKRAYLEKNVRQLLQVDYEIIDHLAGVRPATKFRKPLIGSHPEYSSVHLFNGLGTKGSSLGPYWAKHFMDFLEKGKKLSAEVNINRI